MGGIVARTMSFRKPETWQRMMARDGARFLMLGTPNGGSWSPMQTLSGDDTFGNALAVFGSIFDNGGAREVMAGMPGFIQLQADLLDTTLRLDRAESWQKLADDDMRRLAERSLWHSETVQRAIYRWGAPPQAVLDQAVQLRRALDAQAASPGPGVDKTLLVVGRADFTPAGIVFGEAGLEYLDAPGGGDGRVPLDKALLPGVRTWTLDASHGDLPSTANAFPAYLELLVKGETRLLETLDPSAPGARSAASRPVSCAAGRRAACSRRGRRPSRATSSPRPRVRRWRPAGPDRRAVRCTSRCSMPTSSSCTSRWSSATTARSC
jgi:hypothetical protein